MKKQDTINKIIDYLKNDDDLLCQCMEELDGYNGFLGDDRYYDMEMLNEFYNGTEPTEILTRAFYGRDDEYWETDASGNKIYQSFNPNRNYFYYNGYGNLVSCDYKDYSDKLDDYFIEQLAEYRQYIYAINDNDELAELFDEYEESDEEENG
jgi:hypothetical protein